METYAKIEKCQKQIQGIATYETYIHSLSSKTHTHTHKNIILPSHITEIANNKVCCITHTHTHMHKRTRKPQSMPLYLLFNRKT